MSCELIREEFNSFNSLLKTIQSRPNSKNMRYSHSSEKNDKSFSGTSSYSEAVSLLRYGYTEAIPKIKEKLRENKRVTTKIMTSFPRQMPKNYIAGFVPNVPNALKGLPNSMISIEKANQKRKTLHIVYSFGSKCGTESDNLLKAGVALVSAINLIELSGIQTQLDVGFMPATEDEDEEIVFPTLRVKNYGERFNIQKISFPMIHPSMFRRIGFKYLETCPLCKKNYSYGYGRVPSLNVLKSSFNDAGTRTISADFIISNKFSIEKIFEEMDVVFKHGS